MFPQGLKTLKAFVNNDRGMLPLEHALAATAVAVVIAVSLVSIGQDSTRIYSGEVFGSAVAANAPDKASRGTKTIIDNKGDQQKPGPGLFAHLATQD